MKIVIFDIDGVLTWYPKEFSWLISVLRKNKWKVVILSSRGSQWKKWVEGDLRHWKVKYDELILYPKKQTEAFSKMARVWKLKEIAKLEKRGEIMIWFDDDKEIKYPNSLVP